MNTTRTASFEGSIIAIALIGWCLVSLACGSARRGQPLTGPLALNEREERGRAVFMARCHQCHPGGEAGLGPAINNKPFPEFLKRFQVRHGLGAMPSFSEQQISDEQLDDLMAYLRALRRSRTEPRARDAGAPKASQFVSRTLHGGVADCWQCHATSLPNQVSTAVKPARPTALLSSGSFTRCGS